MSDLISRSALIKLRRKVVEYDEAGFSMDYFAVPVEEIKNAPTVEAKSVVHGEWKSIRDKDKKKCSVCGVIHLIAQYPFGNANFCPNCGSDMRGEKHD